uniref:Uncharacterized protein n=1 Tax=Romanomermis culicivorax TaxID=13658 RepID=A0A915J2F6_ROMCU
MLVHEAVGKITIALVNENSLHPNSIASKVCLLFLCIDDSLLDIRKFFANANYDMINQLKKNSKKFMQMDRNELEYKSVTKSLGNNLALEGKDNTGRIIQRLPDDR